MRLPLLLLLSACLAAGAPDVEDLPPVDELVDQLLDGQISPEQVVDMGKQMPAGYIRDVKHHLPDEMKERIAEIIHSRSTPPPPQAAAVEDPADTDDENAYDEYEDDEYTDVDQLPLPEEPAPEVTPDEHEHEHEDEHDHGEPAMYKEEVEEERPMLRAGSDTLRQDPPRDAPLLEEGSEGGLLGDSGTGMGGGGGGDMQDRFGGGGRSGGGGGSSSGGVIPSLGEGPLTDRDAINKLRTYSRLESMVCQGLSTNRYQFYTVDQSTGPSKVNAELEYRKVWRELATNVSRLDLSGLDSTDLLVRMMVLKHAGVNALDDDDLRQMDEARTNMEAKFARTKLCPYVEGADEGAASGFCGLSLATDVRPLLAASTNVDELQYYWVAWRDLISRNMHAQYATYVSKLTAAARKHNPEHTAWDLLMYPYTRNDAGDILERLEKIWDEQIEPIYHELHKYARFRLRERYGEAVVARDGPIPAHLFGSLEADDWTALEPIMRPVTNASSLDFHRNCAERSTDVVKLKNLAKALYGKLGLNETNAQDFLESRLNAENAENVMMLPSRVIDRCYNDYRRRYQAAVGIYPTNTTLSDYIELIELFGEMQAYNEKAIPESDGIDFVYTDRDSFRDYGLDRAIGGSRVLSALTPDAIQRMLGFPKLDSEEEKLNLQMAIMLKLVPRMAHSMAALRWQAEVLSGRVTERDYNSAWWRYKEQYQGVKPPQPRDEASFDAFADGTITLTNHHLRRLIGAVSMFSVHKSLCRMYGGRQASPLSECSLLDQPAVGHKLSDVLVAGNSRPFQDQLSALTGERDLDGKALVEHLQPASEWLVDFNKVHVPPKKENTQTVAIVVGVIIGVIVLGLVIFFVIARRKQKQGYKGAPTQEMRQTQA